MRTGFKTAGGWVIAVAALYVGFVSGARWEANRAWQRRVARLVGPQATAGNRVKITQFYTPTGHIERGDKALVCYGVENAAKVRVQPAVEKLTPSLARCFEIQPVADTTYTLHAEGHDGAVVSEEFQVLVGEPAPKILFVSVSKTAIRRGEPVAICYGVENAKVVKLAPLGWPLAPSKKSCLMTSPGATTRFTLTAVGADGRTDREQWSVAVGDR